MKEKPRFFRKIMSVSQFIKYVIISDLKIYSNKIKYLLKK